VKSLIEQGTEQGTLLTRLNNSASSVGGAHLLLTFTGHTAIGYGRRVGLSGLFGRLVHFVYLVYSVYLAPLIKGSHGAKANMCEFFHLAQSNI